MKKKQKDKKEDISEDELLYEYEFDYTQARPNRFAARILKGMRVIILDTDVARVFKTNESVNSTLRSLIPTRSHPKRKKVAVG